MHQFLNASAYEVDKRTPSNSTIAWYSSNLKTIYGSYFTALETATSQTTTFTNGTTKTWNYANKKVTYDNTVFTQEVTLDANNKTTYDILDYKDATRDPNIIKSYFTTQYVKTQMDETYVNATVKSTYFTTD